MQPPFLLHSKFLLLSKKKHNFSSLACSTKHDSQIMICCQSSWSFCLIQLSLHPIRDILPMPPGVKQEYWSRDTRNGSADLSLNQFVQSVHTACFWQTNFKVLIQAWVLMSEDFFPNKIKYHVYWLNELIQIQIRQSVTAGEGGRKKQCIRSHAQGVSYC